MTQIWCLYCQKNPVKLQCVYCPLCLYCSASCALKNNDHPCELANILFCDKLLPANCWNLLPQEKYCLDQLYLLQIKPITFDLLISHGICYSCNALNYLTAQFYLTFVWPHEQKAHEKWLEEMGHKIKRQFRFKIFDAILLRWAIKPLLFCLLIAIFGKDTLIANIILTHLNTQEIDEIIFTTKTTYFEMYAILIHAADMPFLYKHFYAVLGLQLTRDNAPSLFFPNQQGKHILLPTLNANKWDAAIKLKPVYPYILSTYKNRWQRAKNEYIFYKNRKKKLIDIFISRNGYFEPNLIMLPLLQAWTFNI